MSKITLNGFVLLFLLFLGNSSGNYAAASATATAPKAQFEQAAPQSQPARPGLDQGGTGTLQKMIVQSGSVTMQLDLNRLNGISSVAERPTTLGFVAAANSFFSVLVFNDQLRGPEPGSIALVPRRGQRPRLQPSRGVRRVAQAAGNRKTFVGSVFRSCSARRQNRIHVFQRRRTPIRLRCHRPVAQHHRGKTPDFTRVCQCARPIGRRQRGSWKDFNRRGDAADRDRPAR